MSIVLGTDIGSITSKGVLMHDRQIIGYHILPSGVNYRMTAIKLRTEILAKAGLVENSLDYTALTGHGSGVISQASSISDIQSCAKGIRYFFPSIKAAIDIQRQSSQVINLDEDGEVTDFAVNEICASGSGYFLEVIANVLQLGIDEIGPLSLKSKHPVSFTTGCAVFGESEAISRVSEGILKEDILAGVHQALADKIWVLMNKIGLREKYAVCGGGGLNIGLINKIEQMGVELILPPQPQIINAVGAALSQIR
jgi:(R)-2-hydroxyacyl-CoA dehydratese activating ATPase